MAYDNVLDAIRNQTTPPKGPPVTPSHPTFPTTEQLLAAQSDLREHQRLWLDRCRELAMMRLPHEPRDLYSAIPEVIWRTPVWGHKVLILHAPPVEVTQGGVTIPESSKEKARYGWVVGVGEQVCDGESRQAPSATHVCPYHDFYPSKRAITDRIGADFSPLMLVGEFVNFNIFNVTELKFDISEGGYNRRPGDWPVFSLTTVGSIWFPVIDIKLSDWAGDQSAQSNLVKLT